MGGHWGLPRLVHMRALMLLTASQGGVRAGFTQPAMGVGLSMMGMPSRQGPRWRKGVLLPGAPPVDSAAAGWGATSTIAGVLSRQDKLTQTTYHVPRATRLQYISLVMYWSRAFLGPRFHAYRDGGSRGHVRRMGRAKRAGAIAEDNARAFDARVRARTVQTPQRIQTPQCNAVSCAQAQAGIEHPSRMQLRATLRSSTVLHHGTILHYPLLSRTLVGLGHHSRLAGWGNSASACTRGRTDASRSGFRPQKG